MLSEHLKLEKAALLLPEPDSGELAPWSIRGFDRTTEHRLRIPPQEMSGHVLDPEAAVTVLSGSRVQPLAPYLSQREFDLLDSAALVPFRHKDRLLGLLLIARSPYLAESADVLDIAFSAISRPIASILHQNRDVRLEGSAERAILDESELRAMSAELGRPENGRAAVAVFEIEELVSAIAGSAEDVDRFRIRQDVLRVIAAIVSEVGTIGTSSSGRVMLLFADDAQLDPNLVLHQLSLQLAELFEGIETPPDLNAEVRRVDHDRERVDEVVAELA
jgi:hypothetical protein